MKLREERHAIPRRDIMESGEADARPFVAERDMAPEFWNDVNAQVDYCLNSPDKSLAPRVIEIALVSTIFGKTALAERLKTFPKEVMEIYFSESPLYDRDSLEGRIRAALALGRKELITRKTFDELEKSDTYQLFFEWNRVVFLLFEKIFNPEESKKRMIHQDEWGKIFKALDRVKSVDIFFSFAANIRLLAPDRFESTHIASSRWAEARRMSLKKYREQELGEKVRFLINVGICSAFSVEITPDALQVTFPPSPAKPQQPLPPRPTY